MRIEILADGTKKLYLSPIEGVPKYNDWMAVLMQRGAAYLTDYINKEGKTEIDKETGLIRKRIVPLDRNQEQLAEVVGDEVGIVCIGCGELIMDMSQIASARRTRKALDKIRIGGLIQMSHEEKISDKEIHVRWKVQPVFKLGIGCGSCQAKFNAIVAEAAETNAFREVYGQLLAEVAVNGKAAKAIASQQAAEIKKATKAKCLHGLVDVYCGVCRRNNPRLVQSMPEAPKPQMPKLFTPFIDVFSRDLMPSIQE